MSRVGHGLVIVALASACGGLWDPGVQQMATGGPLVLELNGPMRGLIPVDPTPPWALDALIGSLEPDPPAPLLTGGAWLVERTGADPGDRHGLWALHAAGPLPLALEWAGPCGVPTADRTLGLDLDVYPDGAGGASVVVVVPLSDTGLATFHGRANGDPRFAADLRATGIWKLSACRLGDPEGFVGAGTVRVRWNGDPATIREWPAPLPWE